MKRLISLLLVLLMITSLLVACSTEGEKKESEKPADSQSESKPADESKPESNEIDRSKRIKVGFAISNFENENFAMMDKLLSAYCEENNIEYLTRAHNSQSAEIMNSLEAFASAGCDGIIFQNSEPDSIQATLDDLAEKGIKVVSYDADVENVTAAGSAPTTPPAKSSAPVPPTSSTTPSAASASTSS